MLGPDGKDYVLCELVRDERDEEGRPRQRKKREWVPAELAVDGKTLQLSCPDGLWINGWEIRAVLGERPINVVAMAENAA